MFAGFDIGGTSARASLFNDDWERTATARDRVRGRTEPEDVAATAETLLEELLEESGAETVERVGVGLAAQLSADGRLVRNSPNLGWRDEPFADRLERHFAESFGEVGVVLVNDLSASLWGERTAGALEDVDDAIAVFVGTGVGGALLSDGDLTVGASGVAGEIGHAKIEPGGRLCGCGQRGCLEAYAGGIHLERQVRELAEGTSELEELVDDGEVDLHRADERAAEVDDLAAIWRRATDGLAVVVANACTLLNPEILLVGGGVVEHCPEFRREFLTKFSPLVLEVAREGLEVRRPSLGDEGGVLGAARLAARE